MESLEISALLKKYKTIAVVGLSPKENRPSNQVARYMKEAGYRIIPVNPGQDEILGEKCYPNLASIPEKPGNNTKSIDEKINELTNS